MTPCLIQYDNMIENRSHAGCAGTAPYPAFCRHKKQFIHEIIKYTSQCHFHDILEFSN